MSQYYSPIRIFNAHLKIIYVYMIELLLYYCSFYQGKVNKFSIYRHNKVNIYKKITNITDFLFFIHSENFYASVNLCKINDHIINKL